MSVIVLTVSQSVSQSLNGLMGLTSTMGRRKPMAWDVTVPDTYAESYISNTSTKPGETAHREAQNKSDKYARLHSHLTSSIRLASRQLVYVTI